jgi:hypothetical protein
MQQPVGHNCFYVLNSTYFDLIDPPNVTLSQVARAIPNELRGSCYTLYFTGQQLRYWDDQPSYLMDEWVAYTNGAEGVAELFPLIGDKLGPQALEIHNSIEFCIYALVYLSIIPNPDAQLSNFIHWSTLRTYSLYQRIKSLNSTRVFESKTDKYLDSLRNSSKPSIKSINDQFDKITRSLV